MVAKRVFYRLHGTSSFTKHGGKAKKPIHLRYKKINNKTLTPKVKHGNV